MNSKQAIDALSALAHEYRLGVFRLLVETGSEGLNAGTIAARFKLQPSSLTFHLQNLQRAGLITQQRKSRQLIYAADFDAMNALVAYLTENCCGGGAAACATACAPASGAAKAKVPNKTRQAA